MSTGLEWSVNLVEGTCVSDQTGGSTATVSAATTSLYEYALVGHCPVSDRLNATYDARLDVHGARRISVVVVFKFFVRSRAPVVSRDRICAYIQQG